MSEHPITDAMLGTIVSFEHDDSRGMITDETLSEIFIESAWFTGWMSKALFWEHSGEAE